MKKLLSTVALSTLLIACSQNNQPAQKSTKDQTSSSPVQTEQSKYAPYSKDEVEAKVQALTQIIENDTEYLPAAVKEAQSFLESWDKHPEVLKSMMESDLDPNSPDYSNHIPMETEQPALSVRAQITSRESQSAFNVQGAIEYILEIQSTNDQPFVLQGMSINRGRCGYYTADFHSKMPVQMSYSSTVSYLLKCRGDQVLEAELTTDQGNVSLSF
ncbi:hypothetical protein WAH70_02625 [Acinetobacter baumannii]|uniref:hypothetical protein n=1 Tax=Acinetobacter TaxID=469 RepID=UPI0007083F12|nr:MULTISPECIES: hypothetical protein [Acinetobacter]AZB97910.1 hypothetical protein DKE45_001270 [Acinetobacter pittii]AZC07305.1 hypothetical protein DKE48_001245 [Acinetobacter nosocomialis]KQD31312.1 hypothetical protein APD12_04735 [Acinetobacter pittii]MCU4352637.1 hypothetical protein [Acinetobacter ursingii]MCU4645459.1 hypothetical protein [Acinetobacter pittii]